ncbi:hypothetical protein V2J09_017528 [Rumex salicifolius]
MDFFQKANDRAVRLKSHHTKFLLADADGQNAVTQHGNGNTKASRWKVEFIPGATIVRLKSVATGLYLSVSDEPLCIGVTGKKVVQAASEEGSIEWVPVKEGNGRVMLRAHTRTFLVANGSSPPWRNAVTHDMLCATEKVDWAIWVVEVVNEDPKKDEEEAKKMKRKMEKEKEDQMRRSYTVPAHSFADVAGGGKGSPAAGALRSVRTLSPQRQSTLLSNSFNNRGPTTPNSDKPLPPELQSAKQAIKEIQCVDFISVFSSERLKAIENAISIFLLHTNPNNQRGSTTKSKLLSIRHHLQTLKIEQKGGANELEEYEDFQERKEYKMGELHREVGRARELEGKERKSREVVLKAKGKREVLLREIEKVERRIKIVEEEQVKNEGEMEVLFRVIGRKNEDLKKMEREESLLVKKRVIAERTIMDVERRWETIKASFLDKLKISIIKKGDRQAGQDDKDIKKYINFCRL